MYVATSVNPTTPLDVGWGPYVASRSSKSEAHLVNNIPDYAFALDCSMRQKLRAMPGFHKLARTYLSTLVPRVKQEKMLRCLKVGPTQMPEVYQMAVDCARRLGIGVPDIFVEHDIQMNAYTLASEQDSPIVVVTTGMIERATPGELKACIGHECGHIHNEHSLYNTLVELIAIGAFTGGTAAIPGVAQIAGIVSMSFEAALMSWSRAAEITCDRAGVICSDDPQDMVALQAKLMSGGAIGAGSDFDVEAIMRQYDSYRKTPVGLSEIMLTHPSGVRRIIAVREFAQSEVLYSWRPEWRRPGEHPLGKDELDARCNDVVRITNNKKRKGGR